MLRDCAARHSEPLGVFQLRQIEAQFITAEWGFALDSAFWGNGYFTEGASCSIDFAVDVVGVRRLEARSAVDNGRGNGALRKIGAVHEGVLRRAFTQGGRQMDAVAVGHPGRRLATGQGIWNPESFTEAFTDEIRPQPDHNALGRHHAIDGYVEVPRRLARGLPTFS